MGSAVVLWGCLAYVGWWADECGHRCGWLPQELGEPEGGGAGVAGGGEWFMVRWCGIGPRQVFRLVAGMAMGIKWLFRLTLPLLSGEGAHPAGTQERWTGGWVGGVDGVIHVVEILYMSSECMLVGQ